MLSDICKCLSTKQRKVHFDDEFGGNGYEKTENNTTRNYLIYDGINLSEIPGKTS